MVVVSIIDLLPTPMIGSRYCVLISYRVRAQALLAGSSMRGACWLRSDSSADALSGSVSCSKRTRGGSVCHGIRSHVQPIYAPIQRDSGTPRQSLGRLLRQCRQLLHILLHIGIRGSRRLACGLSSRRRRYRLLPGFN